MASSLRSNLTFLTTPYSPTTNKHHKTTTGSTTIKCGPRNNRGPLVKGRTLSIEAIQAVQSLKRIHRLNPNTSIDTTPLSRLIKSDLISTFNELLRQDHHHLAVIVFSVIRSEFWYKTDLSMYADLVSALARKGLMDDIDCLIVDLDKEGVIACDDKGLVRLVKALIGADRVESTVAMYRLMMRSGWGSTCTVDDYLAKVLIKGLRRFGRGIIADEIKLFSNL